MHETIFIICFPWQFFLLLMDEHPYSQILASTNKDFKKKVAHLLFMSSIQSYIEVKIYKVF
jgi:hypothetical protein